MWATLSWPTLETKRRIAVAHVDLCHVHRCWLGQAPSFLCSEFKSNSQTSYTGTQGENNRGTKVAKLNSTIFWWNFVLCVVVNTNYQIGNKVPKQASEYTVHNIIPLLSLKMLSLLQSIVLLVLNRQSKCLRKSSVQWISTMRR